MKALDPEKQLRRDSAQEGAGNLHKPSGGLSDSEAKKQAFEKHQSGRPRKPNKNNKKDDKKKVIAAGAAVAGVAVIGVGAVIAHNMGSKTASEKANSHSSDTGLNFGDDSDSSDDSSSSSSKKKKNLLDDDSDSSSSKKGKSSKRKNSKNKLDSLLDGDDSDSSSSGSTLSGDLSSLLTDGSGDSLSALAAQAKKSTSSAKNLGSGSSGSSSKSSKSSGKGSSSSDSSPKLVDTSNKGGSGVVTPLTNKISKGSSNVTNGKTPVQKTVDEPAENTNGGGSSNGGNSSNGGSSNGGSTNGGTSNGGSSSNGGSNSSKGDNGGSKGNGGSSNNSGGGSNSGSNNSGSNSGNNSGNSNSSNSGNSNSGNNSGNSGNTDTPTVESKTISYLDSDGNLLGTGKLTKTTKDGKVTCALDDSLPKGYWVSNVDQLTKYPNYVTVAKVGTSTDENGNTLLTQKVVNYVDKKTGTTLGQGVIYKWQSKDGKVFCTADGMPVGTTAVTTDDELNQYPDKIYVTDQTVEDYPANSVEDGTSKKVKVVTTDGKEVGTATLTKSDGSVTITDIPDGYQLSDLTDDGSEQLLYWPDQVTVVKKAAETYPVDDIEAGTSKQITFQTEDGTEVGTGTLTKTEDSKVTVTGIPDGYQLSDLDKDGHSAQLLQWPDLITVVKKANSGSGSSGTHPSDSIAAGTTKAVDVVDSNGTTVGTAKLTKNEDGSVSISGIPAGYKLSDEDADGQSAQLLEWPDKVTVVGSSTTPTNPDNPDTPSTGESKEIAVLDADNGDKRIGTVKIVKNATTGKWALDPSATLPSGYHLKDSEAIESGPDKVEVVNNSSTTTDPSEETKQVKLVDESGKAMGTGTLKKGTDGKWKIVESTLPDGYKLKDSSAAESAPSQLVVVKVNTDATPSKTSKQITYVDESGKELGKGTLTKESDGKGNNKYYLDSSIPYGYKQKSKDELNSYPDKVTLVADASAVKPGTTSKTVTFVLADGTEVGKGTLTRVTDNNGKSSFNLGTTMPKGYQLPNNNAQVLTTYPDKITVVPVTLKDQKTINVTYVDSSGKKLGSGKLTIKTYSDDSKDYETVDVPKGYTVADKKQLSSGATTIVITKTN